MGTVSCFVCDDPLTLGADNIYECGNIYINEMHSYMACHKECEPPKHHYEIWREGYSATGNEERAEKLGEADGQTFEDACKSFVRAHPGLVDTFKIRNDGHPYLWICRLFDNEADARKSCG